MPLCAVAYVSEVVDAVRSADLDPILRDAVGFNKVAGVTGVLVFDGQRFLQYFEGPGDGVDSVYQRVLNARTHHNVRELARGRIGTRQFPCWTMATAAVDAAALSRMLVGPWQGFARLPADAAGQHVGFARLLQTWTGADGELEPPAVMLGA